MALSNTQRTLRACKEQGLVAAVVEKWNPYVKRADGGTGKRQDMFGIIDVVALDPQRGVIGIQSTSGNCMPAHRIKILEDQAESTRAWLLTPGAVLELWGWRKIKRRKAGGGFTVSSFWEPRIEVITMRNLMDNYYRRKHKLNAVEDLP